MSGSARIKGAALALTFGSLDHWADVTSVVLDNEKDDTVDVTILDVGPDDHRRYFFAITAVQSTGSSSFWRWTWEHTGEVVPFRYAPHGNTVPTAEKPHVVGSVLVGPKPALGGGAGRFVTHSFSTRFNVVGEPPALDFGGEYSPVPIDPTEYLGLTPIGGGFWELVPTTP